MTNENKQFKKNNIVKEEPKEIKSLNWFDKNKFKEVLGLIKISLKSFQLLLAATNLITRIKQVNLSILTLKTWLIILEIMQLVKQMLKRFK